MSNIKSYYRCGKMLGLTTEEIDSILKSNIDKSYESSLEAGPRGYPCGIGLYNVISIDAF